MPDSYTNGVLTKACKIYDGFFINKTCNKQAMWSAICSANMGFISVIEKQKREIEELKNRKG